MSAATVVDPMALLKALAAVPSDAGALQLQQLAHQARALLEHGDTLGVLLHHHEYGDSLYIMLSKGPAWEDQCRAMLGALFEEDRGEYISFESTHQVFVLTERASDDRVAQTGPAAACG